MTKFDPQAAREAAGKLISSADTVVALSVLAGAVGGFFVGYSGTPTDDPFLAMSGGFAVACIVAFAVFVPARLWALALHVQAHQLLATLDKSEAATPAVDRAA